MTLTADDSSVFVVDDDQAICEALSALLRSTGIKVKTFTNSADFLAASIVECPCCVILDVRLQGENGLELPQVMIKNNIDSPVVFITGYGDIQMSVSAMKTGAYDFIIKPFRDQQILDVVLKIIRDGKTRREQSMRLAELRSRHLTLSLRERQVMSHAVNGLMNKQIAGLLGLSEITVKIHRKQAMDKMQARTFADLVKMEVTLFNSMIGNSQLSAG